MRAPTDFLRSCRITLRRRYRAVVAAVCAHRVPVLVGVSSAALMLFGFSRPVVLVEIEACVEAVDFEVAAVDPSSPWHELLAPGVRTRETSWSGARVAGGAAAAQATAHSQLHLRAAQAFDPELSIREGSKVRLHWEAPGKATLTLRNFATEGAGIRGTIRSHEGAELRASGLALPTGWTLQAAATDGWTALPPKLAGFRVLLEEADASVSVVRAASSQAEAGQTLWRVHDLDVARAGDTQRTVPATAKPVELSDRIVFVDSEPAPVSLVARLPVSRVGFRNVDGGREESFLIDGVVRFPDSPHRTVSLRPRFLLAVEPGSRPFVLHSVEIGERGLHLLLSGRSDRVHGGHGTLDELSPTRFDLWYASDVLQWVLSTVVALAAAWLSSQFGK